MPLRQTPASPTISATFRRTDGFFMRRGGARRALYQYLHYDSALPHPHPYTNTASTLRIVCFPGCMLRDLRALLTPFGISLRSDGTGNGVTPAGYVACVATSLGGPRPVLVFWKKTAVEQMLLAGVLKKQNGFLGILPVPVFREVLWPWVKLAVRGEQHPSANCRTSQYETTAVTPQPPSNPPYFNHMPSNNPSIMQHGDIYVDTDDDSNSEIDEDDLISAMPGVHYVDMDADSDEEQIQERQGVNQT